MYVLLHTFLDFMTHTAFPTVHRRKSPSTCVPFFSDASYDFLMIAIVCHWIFGTTVCSSFPSLARQLPDVT
jgi:hypothetical protein